MSEGQADCVICQGSGECPDCGAMCHALEDCDDAVLRRADEKGGR